MTETDQGPLQAENSPHPEWPGPRTLDYSFTGRGRPGILTAVGIVSIVLASLGILRSLWQVLSLAGMLIMSQMSFPMVATSPGGGTTLAGAIAAADADLIAAALSAAQPLSAADQARLSQAIQKADVPLAAPPEGQAWTAEHVASQVVSSSSSGTNVTYMLAGGTITLDPTQITLVASPTGTGISTTTVAASGGITTFTMAANPFGSISMLALAAGAVLEIVNLGLAVLLLTAGIATLRESLKSPRLHNWWALLKFPAVVLSTATGIWIAVTMFDGFGMTATQTAAGGNTAVTTPVFGSMGWLMAIPAIGMGLVACIYPIIILVLFRTRTVREYYAEMRRNSWVAG